MKARSDKTEIKHLRWALRAVISPLRAVADLTCSPEFRRDMANDGIRIVKRALAPKRPRRSAGRRTRT